MSSIIRQAFGFYPREIFYQNKAMLEYLHTKNSCIINAIVFPHFKYHHHGTDIFTKKIFILYIYLHIAALYNTVTSFYC